MLRKYITILLTILSLTAFSQTGKLFDADKQLSSSFTSQVYLDHDGLIWVATRNGLNKYDGYKFHILKKEQETENGMASNYVNCMIQDKSGLFYLGMYGAFQTYDGNQFQDIEVKDLDGNVVPCYMTCFLLRKNGDILAGTSGHGLLKVSDRSHAQQQGGPISNVHTINAIEEDRQGHIWLVTGDQGLLEYDGKNVKQYFNSETERSTMRRLGLDKDGNLYLGTTNQGVFVRSAKGGDFKHIDVTGHKHISAIYCRRDGKMMFGYDGMGLAIYDPQSGVIEDNPYFCRDVNLSLSKVYSIVEDAGGNVWLGLLQKGIFMQPVQISEFSYMGYKLEKENYIGQACVISNYIDKKGRCWVGTDKDGLYCLGPDHRLLKHFKENFPGSILSIGEDQNGRIWVGSYGEGFGYIDADGKSYHKYSQHPSISVFGFAVKNGELWVATMGQGLLRINLGTNQEKAYVTDEKAENDRSLDRIVNDYISTISFSSDGKRLYVATTLGVCCLDVEKESWTNVFGMNCLNYGTPTRVAKEYDGQLWIGTNDGLYCYDLKKKELQHYTTEKGLADNGIASIEQDDHGVLWIATDHGLCSLAPKTGQTRSYFVDNGLQSNEFSDGASCVIYGQERCLMLFGGVGGITWFHPDLIQQTKWDAKVRLVSFLVNGAPINSSTKSDGYQICDTTVIASNRFQLASHDNTFTIQFSTLTYDNPEHISYLYSINGEAYNRLQLGVNEISFTHLPPGTYRFRVKAERNGQTTPEREFTVIIHSPWYRSAWAYCLYLLILGALLWQYVVGRRRKEKDRLRIQEHIHAEEMGEAKLKFFMNISHEIRTPMTLIITPLLSLMKQDNDPQRHNVYLTIKRNAERILNLINQMMDLRKIDKGMMQMRMQETNLIGFTEDIHNMFKHQAESKQITLSFEHDTDRLPVWIDRKNFDKVIFNILSNAFKFTPAGGKINIKVTHDQQNATIAISDNGEKIPEDKLDRIFERFYQTPSSTNDRNFGTGIGLDLTRSLVELHYGVIKAHNLEQGCEFIVSIPLGHAHLRPEEMIDEKDTTTVNLTDMMEEEDLPPIELQADKNLQQRATIIIAEDDDEIRDYLTKELSENYEIHSCINGREALAEVYRSHPDIIISDVMMPEMDGNTLCTQLKLNPQTNHLPVILLTAKNRDEDKLEGLETGADAYIVKPFNMDILRRTIANLINARTLLRQKYGRTEQLEEQMEEVKVKSPDEKLLDRIMSTINKQLNNSDLSVDMIADEVGISRVHLHRKMKELTGQTPHDFIRTLRLKQAANLLTTQNMNITEVVYACGFSNPTSFSTLFKSVYGMSPREYMKEHHK
jgi:signal transduction histidine kinase/DNA-binding response OmpR family regulator/streptogramin lyase